jgi:hypothetical protein
MVEHLEEETVCESVGNHRKRRLYFAFSSANYFLSGLSMVATLE